MALGNIGGGGQVDRFGENPRRCFARRVIRPDRLADFAERIHEKPDSGIKQPAPIEIVPSETKEKHETDGRAEFRDAHAQEKSGGRAFGRFDPAEAGSARVDRERRGVEDKQHRRDGGNEGLRLHRSAFPQ
jgi:hypothetical protein